MLSSCSCALLVTEFTHFDSADSQLHVCDAPFPHFLTLHWWQARLFYLFFCLISFSIFSALVTFLPLSYTSVFCVTDWVSVFTPTAVWRTVIIDAACHCSMKWQAATGWKKTQPLKLVYGDIYISLPGRLHASDTSKSGRVTVYNASGAQVTKQACAATANWQHSFLKQTKWEKLLQLFA